MSLMYVESRQGHNGGFLMSVPGVSVCLGTGYPTVFNGSKRQALEPILASRWRVVASR
jgi:hypothetical protein